MKILLNKNEEKNYLPFIKLNKFEFTYVDDIINPGFFSKKLKNNADEGILFSFGKNYIRDYEKIKQKGVFRDIYHPAKIVDFLSDDLGRWALIGFPGAGNMLTGTILQELLSTNGLLENPKLPHPEILHSISDYENLCRNVLPSWLSEEYPFVSYPTQSPLMRGIRLLKNRVNLFKDSANDVVDLLTHSRSFLENINYFTHNSFDMKSCELLKNWGYKVLCQVRDPVNIVISATNKFNFGEPQILLENRAFFQHMCNAVTSYYAPIRNQSASPYILKYEDLIQGRENAIEGVTEFIGHGVTREAVQDTLKKHLNKELRDEHFWKPGVDKTKYLESWHLDMLDKTGILELGNDFGYEYNFSDRNDWSKTNWDVPVHIKAIDQIWNVYHGKPITFGEDNITISKSLGGSGEHLITTQEGVADRVTSGLNMSLLNSLKL